MLIESLRKITQWVWLALPVGVLFSFSAYMLSNLDVAWTYAYFISFAVCALGLTVIYYSRNRLLFALDVCQRFFQRNNSRNLLLAIFVLGLALRVIWAYLFPINFSSDSATYVALANKLIEGAPYETAGTFAYWPPGYPFILYVLHLGNIEVSQFSIILVNLCVYATTFIALSSVAARIFNSHASTVGCLLFALWPTGIMLAAVPSKELVVILLLVCSFWFYGLNGKNEIKLINYVPIGVLLGVASLVQPGILLFFSVFLISDVIAKKSVMRSAAASIVVILCMIMVITPWSYRNYKVFDQFVLLTSNGGSNFYRANNELATGGYTKQGKVDLSQLSELEQSKEGSRLAKQWIKENPVDFLALSFRKFVLFMGDDSTGVYASAKRGAQQELDRTSYLALKMISTSYWVVLWLVLWLLRHRLKSLFQTENGIWSLPLGFLYFLTIHTIFESNAKYHLPVVWVLILIVAGCIFVSESSDPPKDKDLPT